ncbi:MAG: peptidylprolyl isomerase [Burkholderiaceae bacterium]
MNAEKKNKNVRPAGAEDVKGEVTGIDDIEGLEGFNDPDPQPPVAADFWVSLSYELFDSTGEPLEDVRRNLTYLHGGYGEVLPKIEAAVDGKLVGDEISLYLEPDDAFGDYDADLVTLRPADRLPPDVAIGMTFDCIPGEAADGNVYSVTDIAQGYVVLDGNHPLAGIAVRYEIRIEEVSEADEDAIEREKLALARAQE